MFKISGIAFHLLVHVLGLSTGRHRGLPADQGLELHHRRYVLLHLTLSYRAPEQHIIQVVPEGERAAQLLHSAWIQPKTTTASIY